MLTALLIFTRGILVACGKEQTEFTKESSYTLESGKTEESRESVTVPESREDETLKEIQVSQEGERKEIVGEKSKEVQ